MNNQNLLHFRAQNTLPFNQRRVILCFGKDERTFAFEDAAKIVLAECKATEQDQVKAVEQLLLECEASDLNQVSAVRLPFFASPLKKFSATSKDEIADQRKKVREILNELVATEDLDLLQKIAKKNAVRLVFLC